MSASKKQPKIRSSVKAGALIDNHSQALASVRVRTGLKAGALIDNHSQALLRQR